MTALIFVKIGSLVYFLKYIFIPIFILLIIGIILRIITNRYNSDRNQLVKTEIEDLTNDFLTEIIFLGYDNETLQQKIENFKKEIIKENRKVRLFVLDKLLHIKKNIHETNFEKIAFIYDLFEFEKETEILLKSNKWEKKSLGFQHIQTLDSKNKKDKILPYLYSSNVYLKSNAMVALISLSDANFNFLKDIDVAISRIDELKILNIVYQKKMKFFVDLDNWLKNKNDSLVILTLKLIVRYQYGINERQIKYLLENPSHKIRKELIIAIRELKISKANNILIKHFEKETHIRNKISIAKTLQINGNKKIIPFVSKWLMEEENVEFKFEIVKCIYIIDNNHFNNVMFEGDCLENLMIQKMVLHHKNPYLN